MLLNQVIKHRRSDAAATGSNLCVKSSPSRTSPLSVDPSRILRMDDREQDEAATDSVTATYLLDD